MNNSHLDVYKRQELWYPMPAGDLDLLEALWVCSLRADPVESEPEMTR